MLNTFTSLSYSHILDTSKQLAVSFIRIQFILSCCAKIVGNFFFINSSLLVIILSRFYKLGAVSRSQSWKENIIKENLFKFIEKITQKRRTFFHLIIIVNKSQTARRLYTKKASTIEKKKKLAVKTRVYAFTKKALRHKKIMKINSILIVTVKHVNHQPLTDRF